MLLFKRIIRELTEFNWSVYMRQKKINSGLHKFENFIDIPPFFLNATAFLSFPRVGNSQQI